ncbi:MAG: NOP58 family protein [Thermoplasmata archaeon]|nr:NOP58 family protein [Thermoplasmata archaeon]
MAKYLKTEWCGVFLLDDNGVADMKLFPRDAGEIARRLLVVEKGGILEEEKAFMEQKPLTDDRRLGALYPMCEKVPEIEINCEEHGYGKELLRDASLILAKQMVQEEHGKRERRISQAIYSIDDLLRAMNILNERMYEWYGYFSEGKPSRKNLAGFVAGEWNMGGSGVLDVEEEKSLKMLASAITSMHDAYSSTENYVRDAMASMAPNLSGLVGEAIAARLIASAGGLDRLAIMPSGTIQVLGAEKALFRHIKEGTPPPKHGVIFQHELINRAPKKYRGRIARVMAAEIAIATRADVFTKRNIVDELRKDMEERIREIRGK